MPFDARSASFMRHCMTVVDHAAHLRFAADSFRRECSSPPIAGIPNSSFTRRRRSHNFARRDFIRHRSRQYAFRS